MSLFRVAFALAALWAGIALAQGDPKKGAYIAKAGGCVGCHTEAKKDAVPFAGGRALKTSFGTFYGPNITPHANGIGRWSEADFIRAMRQGLRPDGAHYFPAFPYPSFTKITDPDLRDLWAFLKTVPGDARANRDHDLRFPFGFRFLVAVWKWLFFVSGPYVPDPKQSAAVQRGGYLVEALGHCGECHTARNFLGGPKRDRLLAGAAKGPEGDRMPNLTPVRLKKWTDADLKGILQTAMTPDGDVLAETMGEVVRNTTAELTAPDLAAMIAFLRALPPIPDEPD